jgi:hypothetical protein
MYLYLLLPILIYERDGVIIPKTETGSNPNCWFGCLRNLNTERVGSPVNNFRDEPVPIEKTQLHSPRLIVPTNTKYLDWYNTAANNEETTWFPFLLCFDMDWQLRARYSRADERAFDLK